MTSRGDNSETEYLPEGATTSDGLDAEESERAREVAEAEAEADARATAVEQDKAEDRDDRLKWIVTPASAPKRPRVAVFGGGVAGLTAAHELAERGFDVTVFESERDERGTKRQAGFFPKFKVPTPQVKLGGLAASQYASYRPPSEDPQDANDAKPRKKPRIRAFKPEQGGYVPRRMHNRELPGEHGFRFFPAYYMHIWDMLQRIPVYEPRVVPKEIGEDPISEIVVINEDILEAISNALSLGDDERRLEQADMTYLRRLADFKADIKWVATDRTVYDNVNRITTQATTTSTGRPSLVFPREAPRSFAELISAMGQFRDLGFSQSDINTFMSRLARYLVTSPLRRSLELEKVSAYEFFVGLDEDTGLHSYQYTAAFDKQLRDMPKVLAAFDAEWGDARTNLDTYLQLQLRMDRRDNKADGVLNGPTTEAWFDHWYRHLDRMGVTFEWAHLDELKLNNEDAIVATISEKGVDEDDEVVIKSEKTEHFDYIVIATDAFTAERVTQNLRDGENKIAGTVLELEGFTSRLPPDKPPRRENSPFKPSRVQKLRSMTLKELRNRRLKEWKRRARTSKKAADQILATDDDKTMAREAATALAGKTAEVKSMTRFELVGEMTDTGRESDGRKGKYIEYIGHEKWDRFQNLAGIQYFFDTEFQLVRGHVYYSGSKWGLSSINQAGLWEDRPILHEDGYVSILSVDIGDWNSRSPSGYFEKTGYPQGKAARECTVDEIAREVWRQIAVSLSNDRDRDDFQTFPEPVCYALDWHLEIDVDSDTVDKNKAPYLVPIVDDWNNRPGGYPWNPHGSSTAYVREKKDRRTHKRGSVWMADHGGYEVHKDALVFAGTWTKTFTRMTTMEAACESGRHAVNAILDHWIFKQWEDRELRERPPREPDRRSADTVGLGWRTPFGFVDQSGSSPLRQPTPAGDYCFIFDIENREPADFRPTRVLDERFADRGLPHPWDAQGTDSMMAAMAQPGMSIDPTMPIDPFSPEHLRWTLQHMKNWRVLFEALKTITNPEKGASIDLKDPLGAKDIRTAPPGWETIGPTSTGSDSGMSSYD